MCTMNRSQAAATFTERPRWCSGGAQTWRGNWLSTLCVAEVGCRDLELNERNVAVCSVFQKAVIGFCFPNFQGTVPAALRERH
jgi:hypothetical protein